jgi:hypothetical protein
MKIRSKRIFIPFCTPRLASRKIFLVVVVIIIIIIIIITSNSGLVTRMGEKRNACKILVGKPEGKRPLRRPRRK